MKFTGFAISLALAGVVSSAALPQLPNLSKPEGEIGQIEGSAGRLVTGLAGKRQLDHAENNSGGVLGGVDAKRQLEVVQPVTEGVASSLNGGTGVVGSAVGTVESTTGGVAGTAENAVSNGLSAAKRQLNGAENNSGGILGDVDAGRQVDGATDSATGLLGGVGAKRQLEVVQPVTEGVASTLNGGTGVVGSAVGTVESTTGGVAGTAENAVSNGLGGVKRQFGNLPATTQQTATDLFAGLGGNPSGIYGALANLQTIVRAGEISPDQMSNLPAAVQGVIANLAVA